MHSDAYQTSPHMSRRVQIDAQISKKYQKKQNCRTIFPNMVKYVRNLGTCSKTRFPEQNRLYMGTPNTCFWRVSAYSGQIPRNAGIHSNTLCFCCILGSHKMSCKSGTSCHELLHTSSVSFPTYYVPNPTSSTCIPIYIDIIIYINIYYIPLNSC